LLACQEGLRCTELARCSCPVIGLECNGNHTDLGLPTHVVVTIVRVCRLKQAVYFPEERWCPPDVSVLLL
jgi:hypothetical protein